MVAQSSEHTQMSDLEILTTIEDKFKNEGVKFREPHFDSGWQHYVGSDKYAFVAATSELSPQGNSIEFEVYASLPTNQELRSKVRTSNGFLLISDAVQNHFKFYITRGFPGESPDIGNEPAIGELLEVIIKQGVVSEVKSDLIPHYLRRLKINDPLEKALDLIFEAYRTKYETLSQTTQISNQ